MPEPLNVESRVAQLEVAVQTLIVEFRSHRDASRIDLKALVGIVVTSIGVLAIVIGSLGRAWIAPLEGSISHEREMRAVLFAALGDRLAVNDRRTDAAEAHGQENATKIDVLRESFKETETQFRWATDVGNVRFREHDRLMSLLWAKAYGDELPAALTPNAGPNDHH